MLPHQIQGVGLVKEIRISQGKLTKHMKKTRNYGHRKSQGKVKEKCADEQLMIGGRCKCELGALAPRLFDVMRLVKLWLHNL